MEFKACPQSYLFQYLYGIKQPSNLALAKGSMCHTALERVFDLEPSDRTLQHLQNLLRVAWSDKRMSAAYKPLFDVDVADGEKNGDQAGEHEGRDIQGEIEWGQSALQLLEKYYELENPQSIVQPNPLLREVWVTANLTANPSAGVTGYAAGHNSETDTNAEQTFLVRGIIDRIDLVAMPDPGSNDCLRIIDYKTGKAPFFKYSEAVNERIKTEKFWQLKIYALLIREMIASGRSLLPNLQRDIGLRMLRLTFLTSEDGTAKFLDMDLGETDAERDEMLQEVHSELATIWEQINALVAEQDPKSFVHCDRKFCWCHKVRPRFVPGTVWQREKSV